MCVCVGGDRRPHFGSYGSGLLLIQCGKVYPKLLKEMSSYITYHWFNVLFVCLPYISSLLAVNSMVCLFHSTPNKIVCLGLHFKKRYSADVFPVILVGCVTSAASSSRSASGNPSTNPVKNNHTQTSIWRQKIVKPKKRLVHITSSAALNKQKNPLPISAYLTTGEKGKPFPSVTLMITLTP